MAPMAAPARSATIAAAMTKPAVTAILRTSESQKIRSGGIGHACHRPPTGPREARPDDKLRRTIQYSRLDDEIRVWRILDAPLSRGMTTAAHTRCILMSTGGPLAMVW